MSDRREPEASIEVFELGHYEQMQLSLTLAKAVNPNGPAVEIDLDCLASLEHIFQPFGTITITRRNS